MSESVWRGLIEAQDQRDRKQLKDRIAELEAQLVEAKQERNDADSARMRQAAMTLKLSAQLAEWLKQNGTGGWIDDLRKQVERLSGEMNQAMMDSQAAARKGTGNG
jgi:thioesterase domain-containing protein